MKLRTFITVLLSMLLIFIRTFYPGTAENLKNSLYLAADNASNRALEVFYQKGKNNVQKTKCPSYDNKPEFLPKALADATKEFSIKTMTNQNLMPFRPTEKTPVPSNLSLISSDSASAVDRSPSSDESQKLEDFLKVQSAFSNMSIPANVLLEIPKLPFSYQSPADECPCSGFGFRVHPIYGDVRFHYGTDIPISEKSPIKAFADGTVSFVGEKGGYGLCIIIDHGNDYSTLYAHCSEAEVENGQYVSMGEIVALAGHSGKATGPHLHFEIRKGENFLNPEFYL